MARSARRLCTAAELWRGGCSSGSGGGGGSTSSTGVANSFCTDVRGCGKGSVASEAGSAIVEWQGRTGGCASSCRPDASTRTSAAIADSAAASAAAVASAPVASSGGTSCASRSSLAWAECV